MCLEQLEARLAPALFTVNAQLEIARLDDAPAAAAAPVVASDASVIFFEANVPDLQVLTRNLTGGTDAVLLDGAADGLAGMAAFLAGRQKLASIGIVAHGYAGAVQLGAVSLDSASISRHARDLAVISSALASGGELDLWSCAAAAGPAGAELLRGLAEAGLSVAAADHPVGAAALGGSWALNVHACTARGATPFTSFALSAYPDVLGAWASTGSLATPREYDTATLLPNGTVLVVGGQGDSGYLASAEIYSPFTNTWAPAASMSTPRFLHTATLLRSGKVLVVGGFGNTGYLASAELYDPATNTWSSAGAMAAARDLQSATLLSTGKVLIAGGYNAGVMASAEIYDPGTNSWSSAGAMTTARDSHTATLLVNGKVLVAGGIDNSFNSLASAELYDPTANSWAPALSMSSPRYLHTATALPNGDVLLVGGVGNNFDAQASAELYDFVNNVWLAAGSMATPRDQHTATLLGNGKVLVTGGQSNTYLASAETYDPATNVWTAVDSLATARANHTATLLTNGQVLVAGGEGSTGRLASAELFTSVNPPVPTSLVVQPVTGNTQVAGSPFLFTVQVVDQFGTPVTSYSGSSAVSVSTTPSDPLGGWPLTGTLNSTGFGFFQGNLKSAGQYALTATVGSLTGASSALTVTPAAAAYFAITAPTTTDTGSPISITVKALDRFSNLATSYLGKVHFTSSAAASLPADSALTAGIGVFSATLTAVGSQTITAADAATSSPITIMGMSAPITARGLTVTSFTPTPTGFTVTFNKPFVPADLTMYGNASTIQDVSMVGATSGTIGGTLFVSAPYTSATFKATAIPLDFINTVVLGADDSVILGDDVYTVKLISGSGANGFMDALGAGLDGGGNGGRGNYTATFTSHYQASTTPVLALPDFARGPDSSSTIKVPNNTANGIPVTFYNAANVTDVTFTLNFNPALLSVTGASSGDATDPSSTLTLTGSTAGTATFSFHSTAPLSGNIVLGDILAVVPNSAKTVYKDKELLQLSATQVNGAPFAGVTAPGVHANVYFGDASGDGAIGPSDINPMFSVSINSADGFLAHSLVDPVIIGDVAGDISVDGGDVAMLKSYLLHLPRPAVPTPPGLTGITNTSAPDPTLSLMSGERFVMGSQNATGITSGSSVTTHHSPGTITVIVDQPHPDGSTGLTEAVLALTYDPARLAITSADIKLGSITEATGAWQLKSVIDSQTGQIGIDVYSEVPVVSDGPGTLVSLAFQGLPALFDAPGVSLVQLVDKATPLGESFVTHLADAQGGLVTTIGASTVAVPIQATGIAVPRLNRDLSSATIASALDWQRSDSMSHAEKRAAERFPVSGSTTCDFASPVLEDFGPVRIKNVSISGVGLVVPEPLQSDMLLAVKLSNPAKKFNKTALVRVIHVTQQSGGTWLVGGNFDTPLTYEELCALVMA